MTNIHTSGGAVADIQVLWFCLQVQRLFTMCALHYYVHMHVCTICRSSSPPDNGQAGLSQNCIQNNIIHAQVEILNYNYREGLFPF